MVVSFALTAKKTTIKAVVQTTNVGSFTHDDITFTITYEQPSGHPLKGDLVSISAESDIWGPVTVLGTVGAYVGVLVSGDHVFYGEIVTDQGHFWFNDWTAVLN